MRDGISFLQQSLKACACISLLYLEKEHSFTSNYKSYKKHRPKGGSKNASKLNIKLNIKLNKKHKI